MQYDWGFVKICKLIKQLNCDDKHEFFIMQQYNKMLDKLNVKRDRIADIQDALNAADANDDHLIEYEEWKNELVA